MFKKFGILFVSGCFLLSVIPSNAQKNQIDSLEQLLPQTQDTARVNLLNKLSAQFSRSNFSKADAFAEEALQLATQLDYQPGLAKAYRYVALAAFYNNNHQKAMEYLAISAEVAVGARDWKTAILDYLNIAGVNASVNGNYLVALENYTKALAICEKQGVDFKIYDCYSGIANVYEHQKDYDRSLEYHLKALHAVENKDDKTALAIILQNIGDFYATIKNYDEAEKYLDKSLAIFRETKNIGGILSTLPMLSEIYRIRGDYDRALKGDLEAYEVGKSFTYERGKFYAYHSLGKTYLAMKRYALSRPMLETAAALGVKFKMTEELNDVYLNLANLSVATSNFEDAYRFHQLYSAYADTLRSKERTSQLAEMQVRFETENKEKENQLLKRDNDLNRLYAITAFVGLVAVVIIALLFANRQRLKSKSEKAIAESRQKLLEAELTNAHLSEVQLRKEIEFKNKELTTYALSMVQKNEILEEVRASIEQIIKTTSSPDAQLKKLSKVVDYSFRTDRDWDEFRIFFEGVHNDFFDKLKVQFPGLSGSDFKLCALIRLNLSVKQVAAILRISPESVKIARHRLRKKMNMQTEDNLNSLILNL